MARFRTSGKRRRRQRRLPINVAASVLTTLALYSGISSIFASVNGDHRVAAYWILAAIILDMMDGAVARLTRSVSDFGKELDSLSDIVSFGVAPAVLIYTAYLMEDPTIGPSGSLMATIFVICGALRLARYNSFQSDAQDIFIGLPIPAGAGMVASFVLFMGYFDTFNVTYWVFGPLVIALAALMVSSVRYPKKNLQMFVLAPKRAFRFLILVAIGIAAFHYARQNSIDVVWLPLGSCYVMYGLVNDLIQRFGKSERGLRVLESGRDGTSGTGESRDDTAQSTEAEEST